MKVFKVVLLIVLVTLVVIIVVQNTETVESKILFTTFSMPRAFLLIGTGFVGFLAGYVAAVVRRGTG